MRSARESKGRTEIKKATQFWVGGAGYLGEAVESKGKEFLWRAKRENSGWHSVSYGGADLGSRNRRPARSKQIDS